jgi:hypothetical protein
MGSSSPPADVLIQRWREADSEAAAGEQALLDQAAGHLRGKEASPTILQRTTVEVLRAKADRLLIEAMDQVEARYAALDLEHAAALAALKENPSLD